MRNPGLIALSILALVAAAACVPTGHEPRPTQTSAPKGLPTVAPGQERLISSPRVNLPAGPIESVYLPETSDLVASPTDDDILIVSRSAAHPLRTISSTGEVRYFNRDFGARRDTVTALWTDDGTLLVLEADGDLSRLTESGPAELVGTVDVDDPENTATLIRKTNNLVWLIAGGRMWEIQLQPFLARSVTPADTKEAIHAATASEGLLYLATEHRMAAFDLKDMKEKWSASITRYGIPTDLAPHEKGGAWLLTEKGALIEAQKDGDLHLRRPSDDGACATTAGSGRVGSLDMNGASSVLQRDNQVHIADAVCGWLVSIGLPAD